MRARAVLVFFVALVAACDSFDSASSGTDAGTMSEGGVGPEGGAAASPDASDPVDAGPRTRFCEGSTAAFCTGFDETEPGFYGFTSRSTGFNSTNVAGHGAPNALELLASPSQPDPQWLKWVSAKMSPAQVSASFQLKVIQTPIDGPDALLLRFECGGANNIDVKLKPNRTMQIQFNGQTAQLLPGVTVPLNEWHPVSLSFKNTSPQAILTGYGQTTPLTAAVEDCTVNTAISLGFVAWSSNQTPGDSFKVQLDDVVFDVQ